MERREWLTEQFETSRPRLHAVAYRMLGSHAEADDAVQEAWIRLDRAETNDVENLGGWLTTVVARLCLDRMRARRARREEATDTSLAERPVGLDDAHDPAHQALVADSVGAALLVVLDLLSPAERVAFVLHDIFAVPFDEISEVVGRSPEAARQLASRARRRVQGTGPTAEIDLVRQREVVQAFLAAARGGDFAALLAVLDPDVVLQPDESATAMGGIRATHGADQVAALLRGGARGVRLALLDGVAGLAWAPGGRVRGAVAIRVVEGKIVVMDVIGNRERLAQLDIVLVGD